MGSPRRPGPPLSALPGPLSGGPARSGSRSVVPCRWAPGHDASALRAWPADQAGRWSRGTHPAERRPQAGQVVVLPNGCPPSAWPLIVPPGQGLRLAPATVQRNKWQSLRAPSLRSVGLSPLPFVSGPRGSPSLRAGLGPSFAHPAAGRPPLYSGLLISSPAPFGKPQRPALDSGGAKRPSRKGCNTP